MKKLLKLEVGRSYKTYNNSIITIISDSSDFVRKDQSRYKLLFYTEENTYNEYGKLLHYPDFQIIKDSDSYIKKSWDMEIIEEII